MYVGIPFIYGRYSQLLLGRKAAKVRTLVLTFDDGPGSRLTPAILKLLAEYNAKATFFLLGRNIAGREHIVRQIAAQGHEICSHGYDHLHHWKISPVRAIRDINRGWRSIDEAIGAKRKKYPFRPPYGRLNLVSWLYLSALRIPIVYWTFDVGDTWPHDRRDSQRLASLAEQTGGAVVLAHDFDRSNASVENMVIDSIRSGLNMARKSGMKVLTVSQLLSGCEL